MTWIGYQTGEKQLWCLELRLLSYRNFGYLEHRAGLISLMWSVADVGFGNSKLMIRDLYKILRSWNKKCLEKLEQKFQLNSKELESEH